jgi:hypothetical protein
LLENVSWNERWCLRGGYGREIFSEKKRKCLSRVYRKHLLDHEEMREGLHFWIYLSAACF